MDVDLVVDEVFDAQSERTFRQLQEGVDCRAWCLQQGDNVGGVRCEQEEARKRRDKHGSSAR